MAAEAWKEPQHLVSFDTDGKLVAVEETLKALNEITVPLVIVSVVGPYRTGKSYLMNRLAAAKNGFSVGSTVQGHTKGIWIWCRPHPKRQNCCLVLMDTEGLVDCERANKTDDTYIFALTLLLSSTLVYNCKHALDKTALDALHFVTVATDHIKVKSRSDGRGDEDDEAGLGLDKYFPIFVVAIRDFTLDLEWEGEPVTEDEYLERILKLKKGKGKAVADYNLPRECIRSFFPTRKCFVFPSPVKDDEQLKHLESLSDSQLIEQFRDKRDRFLDFVYSRSEPKKVDVSTVNGRSFAGLTRCYIDAISKGSICVESAVETMARAENQKVAAEALDVYQKEFRRLVQFPTETVDEMSKAHDVCQKRATEHFLKNCICDNDNSYKQAFLAHLQEAYSELQSDNIAASDRKCNELLNQLYLPLTSKNYMQSGGYKMYEADIEQLKIQYDKQKCKGVMANARWSDFMAGQTTVQTQILNADKSISQHQKAFEKEKREREDAERLAQAAGEAQKKMEQALGDQDRSFKEEMQRMQRQMEEDKLLREEEFRKGEKAREIEYQRLLQEGLKEKANLQMEAINMMREEQAKAAREAEENRKMFERMMQTQTEERRKEAAQMRTELQRASEDNKRLANQISQMSAQRPQKSSRCSIQ